MPLRIALSERQIPGFAGNVGSCQYWMERIESLRFEWGEKNHRSNKRRHGVWFEEAPAPSAIRIRASSMIQNTQTTRIGLSSSE